MSVRLQIWLLALSSQVFVLYVHTTRLIKIYIRKVSEMFIFCNSNKHEIMHFNKLTKLSPKFFFHLEKKQVHLHFSFFLSFNLFCLLMVCKKRTNERNLQLTHLSKCITHKRGFCFEQILNLSFIRTKYVFGFFKYWLSYLVDSSSKDHWLRLNQRNHFTSSKLFIMVKKIRWVF